MTLDVSMPAVDVEDRISHSGFSVEVDAVGSEEWSESLEQFEDASLYQTWAYGEVRWGRSALSHLILRRGGEIVAQAQLRVLRSSILGPGIAYLRWGPLCVRKGGSLDSEVVDAMVAALYQEYVERRGLFLRILPNAFIDSSRAAHCAAAFRNFQTEPFGPGDSYRTLVLDLRPTLEQLRKGLDQKWRNQLNRAERNGLSIREGGGAQEFGMMVDLYDQMWARKRFKQSSSIRDFERMQSSLPAAQQLKIFICEQDGKPVSGLMGTCMGDTGIYLFGGTNEAGMQCKGSYLLQWRMIQWLKERGARYYNLGGINPETNPGVYHFKKGFSGDDRLYMEPVSACRNRVTGVVMKAGLKFRSWLRRAIASR